MDDITHRIYDVELPDGTTETEVEATATLTREDFDRIAANLRHLAATTYTPEVVERVVSPGEDGGVK